MKYFLSAFFIALLLVQQDANAYINPGSGSDFFQMFVAIILGVIKFFKNIVKKIKAIFGFKNKEIDGGNLGKK